ncbi:choice-of-anchor B family protein [Gracilimonas sp.]|uniref:choice-of-anchor B family protein n=1 Tax=Gracilimonas sp. TaxID=1974203 RepID=UPI00287196BE|nr:choice-of-anchor B family protein [Gracilimonas sp.]
MRRLSFLILLLIISPFYYTANSQTTADGETEAIRGFARAVDISQGNIFIGEPANVHQPGAVYVFSDDGTEWSNQAQLMASDGSIGEGFGSSISADGNWVLVGSPNANDDNGAVYVFQGNSSGNWMETDKLITDAMESGFGSSVVLHGNQAIVGAPSHNEGMGAVIVFENNNGSWNLKQTIANPDTAGANFGSAIAANGMSLVVGAPQREGGSAYVYSANNNEWTLEETLNSRQVDERSQFGAAVNVREGQIFVGAPGYNSASGAVIVFDKDEDSGEWGESGRLVPFDSQMRYVFGGSITFVDSEVWVGAPYVDGGRGAIYQFQQDKNGNWTGSTKMMSDQEDGRMFAGTMAVEGEVAVIGLTGTDSGLGSASIMERDMSGTWTTSEVVIGEGGAVLDPITGNKVNCMDGNADVFTCNNVDLISFLPIRDIGGDRGVRLNDMWGWTDKQTGKNYAIVGRNEGTSFVDVTDPLSPVYIGNLPLTETGQPSTWRDIKVYKNHAYIVADYAGEHGMQVLDLTELREFDGEPILFEETLIYRGFNSAHNIVINEETGYAFAVGSSGGGQTCGGGLHMINIQDPQNPTFEGCFSDPSTGRAGTGYSHDAQCVIYEGQDEEHSGSEICFGANETAVSIADVTDKENPVALSTASYPDHAYVHQGWLTEDQRYFYQNDELDELSGNVDQTRTIIWDVSDLDDPQFVTEFFLDNPASDHNLYIEENTMYQSNYVSGLQVLDISNPEEPERVGFFDTYPFVEDEAGFSGTWSNYPYFDDIVLMTSSSEGLFILDTNRED